MLAVDYGTYLAVPQAFSNANLMIIKVYTTQFKGHDYMRVQ